MHTQAEIEAYILNHMQTVGASGFTQCASSQGVFNLVQFMIRDGYLFTDLVPPPAPEVHTFIGNAAVPTVLPGQSVDVTVPLEEEADDAAFKLVGGVELGSTSAELISHTDTSAVVRVTKTGLSALLGGAAHVVVATARV